MSGKLAGPRDPVMRPRARKSATKSSRKSTAGKGKASPASGATHSETAPILHSDVEVTTPGTRLPSGGVTQQLTQPSALLPGPAKDFWVKGEWQQLASLAEECIDRGESELPWSMIAAAARLQVGDRESATLHASKALAAGAKKRELARVLISSARHSLGRASIAADWPERATAHFEAAFGAERAQSRVRRFAKEAEMAASAHVSSAVLASGRLRKGGANLALDRVPSWIGELARRTLSSSDPISAGNYALEHLLTEPLHRIYFRVLLAEEFKATGDPVRCQHFLEEAAKEAASADADTRTGLARKLIALNRSELALDLLMSDLIEGASSSTQFDDLRSVLLGAWRTTRQATLSRAEHGHTVLLDYLKPRISRMQPESLGRKFRLIEIGTTREDVAGQGSTRKLADFCLTNRIDFVTVDMDPANTSAAAAMLKQGGAEFQAVTAKGEDYLAEESGAMDFVFLDAYDFDHGKHSELRQARYEMFLGASIDDRACHQMHLECAMALVKKLPEHGLICVDDTWLDDGEWTAKGTLAVPYLLDNGFRLLEARNRAALLGRRPT